MIPKRKGQVVLGGLWLVVGAWVAFAVNPLVGVGMCVLGGVYLWLGLRPPQDG
jgi:hypothetical protein